MTRIQILAAGLLATVAAVGMAEELLPAEKAYQVEVRQVSSNTIEFDYKMAPGYILYKDRFTVDLAGTAAKAEISLPAALSKFDTITQKPLDFYRSRVTVRVTVPTEGPPPASVAMTAQGCALEVGVCYPPIRSEIKLPAQLVKSAPLPEGTCTASLGKGSHRTVHTSC